MNCFVHNHNIERMIYSDKIKSQATKYTAKVKSITSVGMDEVYNTEVEGIHAYDGNGFIVHNCANDHNACPIFSGDTRITMAYVGPLDPFDLIPKRKLIPMLEAEAPDFLCGILNLEIPESNDRLNVPVITTSDKIFAQELNMDDLDRFIKEKCQLVAGHVIKFSEFFDRFLEYLDSTELHKWSKIRVGRQLNPQVNPKARMHGTGQFNIGNIMWAGTEVTEKLPRLIIKGDYLESVQDES